MIQVSEKDMARSVQLSANKTRRRTGETYCYVHSNVSYIVLVGVGTSTQNHSIFDRQHQQIVQQL